MLWQLVSINLIVKRRLRLETVRHWEMRVVPSESCSKPIGTKVAVPFSHAKIELKRRLWHLARGLSLTNLHLAMGQNPVSAVNIPTPTKLD